MGKKIKNNGNLIPIEKLSHVMEALDLSKFKNNERELKMVKKINHRILQIFRKKIHYLTIEQIVNFVYKMVKLNHQ